MPVAAAISISAGCSDRHDISHTDLIMPSGITPVPVGVSVAIRNRSYWSASTASLRHKSAVLILPAWQICSAILVWLTIGAKSSSGMATGPPLM